MSSQPGVELTRVNGKGLWNSWTRNFKTPLLALLDLFDNAIDAPLHGGGDKSTIFPGKIHVKPDSTFSKDVTGIYMINNSSVPIKDIGKILEVYASTKGKDAESIGENGVGLKQGCATLSDMSLVLVRNKDEFCLGFIAALLQREEGVYLPSFTFRTKVTSDDSCMESLRQEMLDLFAQHRHVGECVEMYGNGDLHKGIDRLIYHFGNMALTSEWSHEQYVFCVILHELKHGGQAVDEAIANTLEGAPKSSHSINVFSERAKGLLKELEEELPHHYIHIPQSFTVVVNKKTIQFLYWQQRLVELSEFYVKIDKKNLYTKAQDWIEPKEYDLIRIFCGFDPFRLGHADLRSTCSLHMYSRQSGRLIKYDEDARAVLRLNNSGTTFCQGLTVIVDDMQGYLPLNPTKQDIAFGEEAHGAVHKTNLFAWVGAIAAFYYNHHLDRCDSGRPKSALYAKIQSHATLTKTNSTKLKSLDQGNFTRFSRLGWYRTSTQNIRVKNKTSVVEHLGAHTLKRLSGGKKTPNKKSPTPKKKRKKIEDSDELQDETDYDSSDNQPIRQSLGSTSTNKKKKATKTTNTRKTKKIQHKLLAAKDSDDSSDDSSNDDDANVAKILMLQEIKELKETLTKTENDLREEKVMRSKAEQRLTKKKAQNEQLKLSLHRLQKSYQQNNHMSSEENHPENPNNDTSLITERDSLAAKLEEQKKLTADTIHQMKEQQKKLIKLNQFCEEMDASNQEIADRIAAKFQAKIALLESELSHKSMQNKKMHEQLLHFKGVANLV